MVPLTGVKKWAVALDGPVWGLRSLTRAVPAAVPSLAHSSVPWSRSSAAKNSRPPAAVRWRGYDPAGPGPTSLTITVPAAVPSDFHSSVPVADDLAEKNRVPPAAARLAIPLAPPDREKKSLTRTVP